MRSLKLARWLFVPTVRRYMVAVLMGSLALGLFGFMAQWVSNAASLGSGEHGGLGAAALRTIRVDSFGRDGDPKALNGQAAVQLRAVDHVTDVCLWDGTDVVPVTGRSSDTVVLSLARRCPGIQRPLLRGDEPVGLNQVAIPAKMARELGLDVGAELPIEYITMGSDGTGHGDKAKLTVAGLWDDSVPGLDPARTVYADFLTVTTYIGAARGQSPQWIADHYTFTRAYVTVATLSDVTPTVAALQAAGFGATSLTTLLTSVSGTQAFLEALRSILAVLVAVLLAALAWTTASSIVAARRSEVGLLRAIGWRRGEVRSTFALQLGGLGLVVGLVGSGLALALKGVTSIAGQEAAVFGVPLSGPWNADTLVWVLVPFMLAVVLFVAGGLPQVERLARMPADEVLRDTLG